MATAATVAAFHTEIAALPRPYTPELRVLRKRWSERLKGETGETVIAVARALASAQPQETKWMAYELVRVHKTALARLDQALVEDFASDLASWYAVDAFGTLLIGPLWARGRLPDGLIDDWSRSQNRWLRRSALVATVGLNSTAAGRAGDPQRTLPICLRLAADRDDMVEKAASWALRKLSDRDREAVATFMAEHGHRFAARVRREVGIKLATGRKTGRKAAGEGL